MNQRLKTNNIARYYKYRLPYRKTCFDFIKLNTNLRLKFLIQNFIQKYFSIQVETKLIHSLNAHKNQNYFRLAFPIWKKKKYTFIKKFRTKDWKQKQIYLTSRFLFTSTIKELKKIKTVALKKNKNKFLKKKSIYSLEQKKKKKITHSK